MAKVAYRFVPCDDTGRPRENSQFTTIRDASEKIESGAIISADLLGFQEWEVVEVRESAGPLGSVSEADGTAIPLGGSIVVAASDAGNAEGSLAQSITLHGEKLSAAGYLACHLYRVMQNASPAMT
jgi:hypothetical protein